MSRGRMKNKELESLPYRFNLFERKYKAWMGRGAASRNGFEALCDVIYTEMWCIDQDCGTCGHGLFRLGLKKLAQGMHPDLPDWPVTKECSELMRGTDSLFPPMFVKFKDDEQKALSGIINDADFEKLSIFCNLRQILTLSAHYTDGIKY